MAHTAPNTAAAPAMSVFMGIMASADLIDSPPLSKTMPLPTKASLPLRRRGR